MGRYTYKCGSGHRFEITKRSTEITNMRCPNCNSKKFRRVYQPPIIQFRGKGFYVTDNKKG